MSQAKNHLKDARMAAGGNRKWHGRGLTQKQVRAMRRGEAPGAYGSWVNRFWRNLFG